MATSVKLSLEYVVQRNRASDGEPAFDPLMETEILPIETYEVKLKRKIIDQPHEEMILGIRPAEGGFLYQMARRKDVVKLTSDAADSHLSTLQLVLKAEFTDAKHPTVAAAYPILSEHELEKDELQDKRDWKLVVTAEFENGEPQHFRLYNVREVGGGGVVPPCDNPTIDCTNPKDPSELLFCKSHGCI